MIKNFLEIKEELKRYSSFEKNWDGYNADKFSEKTISSALYIINNLHISTENQLYVVPGPMADGRIDLEVYEDNKVKLTLTIRNFKD